jgi:dihydroflavonol-4-reductase
MNVNPVSNNVLVTGVSGFLGLHTALYLLERGATVRGTVRTETLERDVRAVLSKLVDTSRLEIVQADLMKDDGWHEAVRGCDFVLHVASPFPKEEPEDENELILPAREGTLRVLHAAHEERVKRVVVVSSVAAIIGGHTGENKVFDDSDWTDLKKVHDAYSKSKTLAEQAAWDFINSAENANHLEMVSANPSVVFGPILDNRYHTSIEWFLTLMRAEVPGVARIQLDMVDVRDVAEMIYKAMVTPASAGKRFICHAASLPLQEFAKVLQRNFSGRGYRIPTHVLPDVLVRLYALFMPKMRGVAEALGWRYGYSTAAARFVLGWQPRPCEQTIIEMAESMIQQGLVS